MAHASLKCQAILDACRLAAEAVRFSLDHLPGSDPAELGQLRRDIRAAEGPLALALAAKREG